MHGALMQLRSTVRMLQAGGEEPGTLHSGVHCFWRRPHCKTTLQGNLQKESSNAVKVLPGQ